MCLISLEKRELGIKNTVRYNGTPNRMTKNKKIITSIGEAVDQQQLLKF